MNKELLENGTDVQDTPEENNYQRYLELGGIINEKDYNSALARLKAAEITQAMPNESRIKQVENMVKNADIELRFGAQVYRIFKLYSILRSDRRPEEVKQTHNPITDQPTSIYHDGVPSNNAQPKEVERHHSEMTDPRIFREALLMLEDTDALDKLKDFYHTKRPIGTRCPLCGQIQYNEKCL